MGSLSGAGAPRFTAYATIAEYNASHGDAPTPLSVNERNCLRSFTRSSAGLEDDLTASEKIHTLDFLPGGAPEPDEPDRVGTVVATRWGNPPYLVLAEHMSLRDAWKAITDRWPTKLSGAIEALHALGDADSQPS